MDVFYATRVEEDALGGGRFAGVDVRCYADVADFGEAGGFLWVELGDDGFLGEGGGGVEGGFEDCGGGGGLGSLLLAL